MPTDAPMVLILMGVSGSGKTTVGRQLADEFGWPFYEGDDFHSDASVEKMSRGVPLDDADRKSWLEKIHDLAARRIEDGRSAVVACSALKQKYRATIRGDHGERVQFVYLKGSFDLIKQRLKERTNHYMPASLLKSQFKAMQEPDAEEEGVVEVNIAQPPPAIAEDIRDALAL